MKTVLLINSSGAHFFKRDRGIWQHKDHPETRERLWVIADLAEESLESFKMPLLFGRDRSKLLERHLAAAFPHSRYRAAPIISGISSNLLRKGVAVLTGLTTAETVSGKLEELGNPIVGVWGMAMLLTLMVKRLSIANVILAIPSAHNLRILVVKEGIPVLTRCVHRFSDVAADEDGSDVNEILRTSQHLEHRRIFEHDAMPPVLYLGDVASTETHLIKAGLKILPLPVSLAPKGDAGYLHAVLEYVASSPHGQLAPLQMRAHHVAENIRRSAYAGIAACLLAVIVLGQKDFRALIDLHERERTLLAEQKQANGERELIAGRISATGKDPALVRQATKFAALEMDSAPAPESIFQFVAAAIADLPQVRIKSLSFRFPAQGERYCDGHTAVNLPLLDSIGVQLPVGGKPRGIDEATGIPVHHAELQFTIMLPGGIAPAAQSEIRKRISAALKADKQVQLMQDPAAFLTVNTLKGGIGMDTANAENLWCMSIPWKPTGDMP